jgi:hypothetical protein
LNATNWKTNGKEKLENGTLSTDGTNTLVAWYKVAVVSPSSRTASLGVKVTQVPKLIRMYVGMLEVEPKRQADYTFAVDIEELKNVTSMQVNQTHIASDFLQGDPEDYETTFTMDIGVSDAGAITLALKDFGNGRSDEMYQLGTYGPTETGKYVGIMIMNGDAGGRVYIDNFALPACEGTGEYMALQKYARLVLAKESHQF